MRGRITALAVAIAFFGVIPAYAHTSLVSSTPANKAILHKSPSSISLTFNEELIKISGKNVSKISLTDGKGAIIALPEATVAKQKVTVSVPKLKSGTYKITYRVVSSDGHPVSGTITFRVH